MWPHTPTCRKKDRWVRGDRTRLHLLCPLTPSRVTRRSGSTPETGETNPWWYPWNPRSTGVVVCTCHRSVHVLTVLPRVDDPRLGPPRRSRYSELKSHGVKGVDITPHREESIPTALGIYSIKDTTRVLAVRVSSYFQLIIINRALDKR